MPRQFVNEKSLLTRNLNSVVKVNQHLYNRVNMESVLGRVGSRDVYRLDYHQVDSAAGRVSSRVM